MSPSRPSVSRKATRSSPSSRTLTGGQSGSGSSSAMSTGSQKRRSSSPIGVPGPTRVSSSLSDSLSIGFPPRRCVLDVLDAAQELVSKLAGPHGQQPHRLVAIVEMLVCCHGRHTDDVAGLPLVLRVLLGVVAAALQHQRHLLEYVAVLTRMALRLDLG